MLFSLIYLILSIRAQKFPKMEVDVCTIQSCFLLEGINETHIKLAAGRCVGPCTNCAVTFHCVLLGLEWTLSTCSNVTDRRLALLMALSYIKSCPPLCVNITGCAINELITKTERLRK